MDRVWILYAAGTEAIVVGVCATYAQAMIIQKTCERAGVDLDVVQETLI